MSEDVKNVAVLGASGYTGAEAVRLILNHPKLRLAALTGHSRAGERYGDIYPNFAHFDLPPVTTWQDVEWEDIDVVFACLPHGASQDTIAQIIDKVETVIDLSADFRLWDVALYAQTYGRSHDHPALLDSAVYGLTELNRAALTQMTQVETSQIQANMGQGTARRAKLVACPGCYPTCSLLSLLPALEADLIETDQIIIDAKSGVTGAGRKSSSALIYSEISDGAHAYSVASHRHAPEIDQVLSHVSGNSVTVSFTPHLLPMNRGMITTSYVTLKKGITFNDLREAFDLRYKDEPFVHIEAQGGVPQTRHVRGSNHCRIGLFADRIEGRAIIISVIDNLTKGSSGQAIQNYNVIEGWDERLGLDQAPIFP